MIDANDNKTFCRPSKLALPLDHLVLREIILHYFQSENRLNTKCLSTFKVCLIGLVVMALGFMWRLWGRSWVQNYVLDSNIAASFFRKKTENGLNRVMFFL